ncbi:MAG: tyrosine-type recombinase/integrase [Treponema sp.]|nr:tyrosine-type recombinase/integrase [Treponema sp.]
MRSYYLHKRKNGFYYVEYIDQVTKTKLSARSTGERDKIKAQVKAELWLVNGVPTGRIQKPRPIEEAVSIETILKTIRKSDINADDALRIVDTLKKMDLINISAVKNTGRGAVIFADFLTTFWDYEKSEYITDLLNHNRRFTRRYAHECQKKVKNELIPFFGEKKLNCITTDDLKRLTSDLAARGLSASTINQTVLCACTPLKWAFNQKIIPENPCMGLTKFSINSKKRGVLTQKEITDVLYNVQWKDKRAQVASIVAFATGARQGEVLALRPSDIVGDFVNISHSYSPMDGLKCTKTGNERNVYLQPFAKAALMDLLKENPFTDIDDPFFFYSVVSDKPCDCKILLCGLYEAMEKAGIDWKKRTINFHSWRHWFVAEGNKNAESKKVMKASGHLTDAVFNNYAAHVNDDDVREVGIAMSKVYSKIVPDNVIVFPVKKAV